MPEITYPDIDRAALCQRFEAAVIAELGEPQLPISSFAEFETGDDHAPDGKRFEYAGGITTVVFHDGSKIRFEIEWGNVPFNRPVFDRAVKKCIANIPAAARYVTAERAKIYMLESVVAAIMLEARTIGEFRRIFQTVLGDKTGVRITPLSHSPLFTDRPIERKFGQLMVRIRKVELRHDTYRFREVFLRPNGMSIDMALPETVTSTFAGRPLSEAVDLPAFRDTNVKIKAASPHDTGMTAIDLDAPRVGYAEAIALAVKISQNSLKGAEPRLYG